MAKFNWDPKAVPFDQFDARSASNARNASESQVYRDQVLASIKDRLNTAAVKRQALDLCQELFLADGARSAYFCSMCGPHFCSMKITGDVRKFAAEQGIDEASAIERGLHEKAKEFQQRGAEVYAKA